MFGWSPSGRIVYAGEDVLNLELKKTCTVPSGTIFITDDLAMGTLRLNSGPTVDWNSSRSHFTFFNASCQAQATWIAPGKWGIVDFSPDRGLLSVLPITYPA